MNSLSELSHMFFQTVKTNSIIRRSCGRHNTNSYHLEQHKSKLTTVLQELSKTKEVEQPEHKEPCQCSICLNPLNDSDILHLPCSHMFHRNCVEQWITENHSCPVCRINTQTAHLLDGDIISIKCSRNGHTPFWSEAVIERKGLSNDIHCRLAKVQYRDNIATIKSFGNILYNIENETNTVLYDNGKRGIASRHLSSKYNAHKRRRQRQRENKRRHRTNQ